MEAQITASKINTNQIQRAVVYARVSKDDRHTDGRNLQSQLQMGREYAQSKGFRIIDELAEDERGASGVDINLPQLSYVREMAQQDKFDVLVVREIDRLSRNLAKQLIVEEELKRAGVRIDYVLANYEDTPEGRLAKHIRATIAEYEREKINERMTRGRENKVKGGEVIVGDMVPYGYEVVDSKLKIYEPEAKIVRLIFHWYTVDGLSIRGIKRKLDDMTIPTPAKANAHKLNQKLRGKWATTTIHNILSRQTYIGIWHYGKFTGQNIIPVQVPSIISMDTWETTKARLEYNKRFSKRNRRRNYLLSNRSTCGLCGYSIVGLTKKSGQVEYCYYACNAKHSTEKYTFTCKLPYIRGDQVEPVVWEWVRSLLTDPDFLEAGLSDYRDEKNLHNQPILDQLGVLEDLLLNYQDQLNKLLDLYLEGEFPKEVLSDRKERLEKTVHSLEKEKQLLTSQLDIILTDDQIETIKDFASTLGEDIQALDEIEDFEAKRRLLELLDVAVKLTVENEEKVAYVRCALGENRLPIVSPGISTRYRENTTTDPAARDR